MKLHTTNKKIKETAITQKAVLIKSKLTLDTHKVSREFIIPLEHTFEQLHDVMQVLYDWDDYHMYSFTASKGRKRLCSVDMETDEDDDFFMSGTCDQYKSHNTKLKDVLMKHKKWIYLYDFGDDWEHELAVGKIIDDFNKGHAICLSAEGIAPPEDCGGMYGFENLLEIVKKPPKDKKSDEYEEYKYAREIIESLPKELNLDDINELLQFTAKG